jgi:hypothetical protein
MGEGWTMTNIDAPRPGEAKAINELGDSELIKRINEEVGFDLAADRSTYTRAVALGEMLVLLRNRKNDKRGWRKYLEEKCPKLAYETATLYIRLYDKQDAILAAAKAQSVTVTDMTVRLARKLIATPRGKGKGKGGGKSGDQELGNNSTPPPPKLKDFLQNTAADELFEDLKAVYEEEQMRKLSTLISMHLRRPPRSDRPDALASV